MRAKTRFNAGALDVALIQLNWSGDDFQPDHVALVDNESFTGAALILKSEKLVDGQKMVIRVGELPLMPARLVWKKEIEKNLFKIGIEYIE